MKNLGLALLASLVAAAGCSSGSSFDDTAADVEGIYHVQSYTANDAACSPGGDSQLGSETFALATQQELFGIHFLTVMSCASIADCRDKLAKLDAGTFVSSDFGFTAESASGDDTLTGTIASTGFSTDGSVCTGGQMEATTMKLAGTALRIENAITEASDYPAGAGGECTTDAVQGAVAGHVCSRLEVLTADFVEAL